jgi:hypothetical protein
MDGHALYELKLDAAAVRAAMAAASDQDVVKKFVKSATQADLDDEEIEALRNEAAKRSGISKRTRSPFRSALCGAPRGAAISGELLKRSPTTGTDGCCACAASGQAAAPPPAGLLTTSGKPFF